MSKGVVKDMAEKSGEHEHHSSGPDPGFVAPATIVKRAERFKTTPEDAIHFLEDYGDLKPRTSVSLLFRIRGELEQEPRSLLPLLADWLELWFQQSLQRRDKERDKKNWVAWLLQYTADYIALGHYRLPDQDVLTICQVAVRLANLARNSKQILGCFNIFIALIEVHMFPLALLRKVVPTLCSAAIILDDSLPAISDCIYLLATEDLSDQTITILINLLVVHARHDEDKKLNDAPNIAFARGAAVQLSQLLVARKKKTNAYAVNITDLLTQLDVAADAGFVRLGTNFMQLCSGILSSERGVQLTPDSCNRIFSILEKCMQADLIPSSAEVDTSEEPDKRRTRYERDRQAAVLTLQHSLLPSFVQLSSANQAKLYSSGVLTSATTSNRAVLLDYARDSRITEFPHNPDWWREVHSLIQNVVRDSENDQNEEAIESQKSHPGKETHAGAPKKADEQTTERVSQRTQQRCDIMHMLGTSIRRAIENASESTKSKDDSKGQAIALASELVDVLKTSKHAALCVEIKFELLTLSTFQNAGAYPFLGIITTDLVAYLSTSIDLAFREQDNARFAAEALVSIFIDCLNKDPGRATKIYGELLNIASQCKNNQARIAVLRLLLRLRADTMDGIYVIVHDNASYLAKSLLKYDDELTFSKPTSAKSSLADSSSTRSRNTQASQWTYVKDLEHVKSEWPVSDSTKTTVQRNADPTDGTLNIADWVWHFTNILQQEQDWEVYSFLLVHLTDQLTNTKLFCNAHPYINMLRQILCGMARDQGQVTTPPKDTGLRKSNVLFCIFNTLTGLIPYSTKQLNVSAHGSFGADLIRAFLEGLKPGSSTENCIQCIHALSLCTFEIPDAMAPIYPAIIESLSTKISTPELAVHILEFLAQVARLRKLHQFFTEAEVKRIFGMSTQFMKIMHERREKVKGADSIRPRTPARGDGDALVTQQALDEKRLLQYSTALAYHTVIFWFLSIPMERRRVYAEFLIKNLVFSDMNGKQIMHEQSRVLVDMMQRSCYNNLHETARDDSFGKQDPEQILSAHYIDGTSVISVETDRTNGSSQITKRQAAGTTHAYWRPSVQSKPSHHEAASSPPELYEASISQSHVFLSMVGSARATPISEQPVKLPDEPYVTRMLAEFDRVSDVDSHNIGIVLLKDGQTTEEQFFRNESDTPAFRKFLEKIGYRVSLQPPLSFIPYGLRYPEDGTHTIAWRDRINELVFMVNTMMPNTEEDGQLRKKKEISDPYVLIVFNQSRHRWQMSQHRAQNSIVHIVITPNNQVSPLDTDSDALEHEFFLVEVLTRDGYQNMSVAAHTKVVSKDILAPFVRMVALNATIFSHVALRSRPGDAEFPSSWRDRLQKIDRLREMTLSRVPQREDTTASQWDFSRWT